jgi:hypothetical protein
MGDIAVLGRHDRAVGGADKSNAALSTAGFEHQQVGNVAPGRQAALER